MTYIIAEPCIETKDAACVEVCPVDCIYEGEDQYYIHPEECIDCTLCEPECPAEAIFSEEEIPDGQEHFLELNKELSAQWPVITEKGEQPPDAEDWDGRPGKLEFLER